MAMGGAKPRRRKPPGGGAVKTFVSDTPGPGVNKSAMLGILWVFIAVIVLILLITTLKSVPAGHVGIVDLFGSVRDETLAPGLHIVNPFARVVRMSVQTREIKETAETPSSEGLNVHLELSVLYHLQAPHAVKLYKTVGLDIEGTLINPVVRSTIREVTASYPAKALYSAERDKMGKDILTQITAGIEPRGIGVERVLLRNVQLPGKLQGSIQEKLSAEQEAARMEFILQKERQEAERKKIEAEGIATFQRIVTEGISENLLRWKGIEVTRELATSQNAKVVVIGSGKDGLPIILGSDVAAPHR
jgi:regulator of protease activity HflC (stomatin/prohibitin superfamily)